MSIHLKSKGKVLLFYTISFKCNMIAYKIKWSDVFISCIHKNKHLSDVAIH